MKLGTAAALGFLGVTCLVSTVVVAADIEENALHSPWLPDPDRTPGAINPAINQGNIATTICDHGVWSTKSERPPPQYTGALKREQLNDWGYADKNPRHYEEDHLISLEIGGAPVGDKNLWPEPYAGKWGAHVKDKLEDRLNELVCNHTLTLVQAQTAIATNWITAYQRYVLNMPETATAP